MLAIAFCSPEAVQHLSTFGFCGAEDDGYSHPGSLKHMSFLDEIKKRGASAPTPPPAGNLLDAIKARGASDSPAPPAGSHDAAHMAIDDVV